MADHDDHCVALCRCGTGAPREWRVGIEGRPMALQARLNELEAGGYTIFAVMQAEEGYTVVAWRRRPEET